MCSGDLLHLHWVLLQEIIIWGQPKLEALSVRKINKMKPFES